MPAPQTKLWRLFLEATLVADLDAMRSLLQEGAGVDRQFHDSGFTALHQAIATKNHKMAVLLISYGASVEHDDNVNRQTPVMSAILIDDLEMVKHLAANGAAINAENDEGGTYADYARELGREEIAKYIDTELQQYRGTFDGIQYWIGSCLRSLRFYRRTHQQSSSDD